MFLKTLLPGSLRHTHLLQIRLQFKKRLNKKVVYSQATVRRITGLTSVKGTGCSNTDFVWDCGGSQAAEAQRKNLNLLDKLKSDTHLESQALGSTKGLCT